jgi:hypothetical protein
VAVKKPINNLLVCFLIITLSTFNFGCTSKRSLPIETHLDLHSKKVALVPSIRPIKKELDLYANGRIEGAFKGAGDGISYTLGGLGSGGGSCDGDFCGLFVLVYLAAAVVGGTIGSIHGAVTSPSGNIVNKMEEGLKEKTHSLLTQKTFSQLLLDKISQDPSINIELSPLSFDREELVTKRYEDLKLQGFQKLISVELAEIEFVGGKGEDPLLGMILNADVKIIDLGNQIKSITKTFSYSGPKEYYSKWIAMDPNEIKNYFSSSVHELIDDIYYDIFVTVDLQIPSGNSLLPGTERYGCCWVCPEDPPLEYSLLSAQLQYPIVESVRPTLKWFSFPSSRQEEYFARNTGKSMGAISYDLKIWQGHEYVVFEATDIRETHHLLETSLDPKTNYYWSVRACFVTDGKKLCTRWGSSTWPKKSSNLNPFKDYCEVKEIWVNNFYRFKTPSIMIHEDVEKLRPVVEFENQTIIADQSKYKAGDIVLVEFKNGETRTITITNINDRFLVGYYDFELGHYQVSNSWDTRSIKSMTHVAK